MNEASFTVLLIEDEPNDALLIERAFRKNGFEHPVKVVANGEMAISYLLGDAGYTDRTAFPFPRIIITDLKMPRMGGLELLQWVKENAEYTVVPIVVLTSSADEDDVKQAFCLGANAYFVKPAQYQDLQHLVKTMMDYWQVSLKPTPGPC